MIQEGKLIEPLMQLYKDEVRSVGEALGLSEALVWRHPFPGPGLAVRCLCSQEPSLPENHTLLENSINEEIAILSLKGRILPIQSVGVQGDYRTYRHPLAITGEADFVDLGNVATDVINHHKELNRVVWKVNPGPIETVTVHNAYLTRERIALLQQADKIVSEFIRDNGLMRAIWQFPTVLIPVSVNRDLGESLVLRPVESEEAMTANFYQMDRALLLDLTTRLMAIPGITAVFYDVTNKPPGTIEWE